jgi:hypothetical protein
MKKLLLTIFIAGLFSAHTVRGQEKIRKYSSDQREILLSECTYIIFFTSRNSYETTTEPEYSQNV